mgnify:CR=1 FL=1
MIARLPILGHFLSRTGVRISVLEKVNLKELITKQDPLPSHNQCVKELSLFDDIYYRAILLHQY